MGFLNKLKSVNNSWGYVTYLSDGSLGRIFGRIGPKNLIDNRSQELMITSGTINGPLKGEIVFAATDVLSATVLQATSEWVKYRLELKTGLVAIVVMTVMGLPTGKAQGNKTTLNANFNDAWLNFEAWLGEALERKCDDSSYVYSAENSYAEEIKSEENALVEDANVLEQGVSAPEQSVEKIAEYEKCDTAHHVKFVSTGHSQPFVDKAKNSENELQFYVDFLNERYDIDITSCAFDEIKEKIEKAESKKSGINVLKNKIRGAKSSEELLGILKLHKAAHG